MWRFWLLGSTLEFGLPGRARLVRQAAFGGTVSIQHSPHPALGPEPVTRGFDCLGNQCGGSGEESRVGTTDPSKNNRAPNPKGLTGVLFQIWKLPVVLFVVGNLCGWLFDDWGSLRTTTVWG